MIFGYYCGKQPKRFSVLLCSLSNAVSTSCLVKAQEASDENHNSFAEDFSFLIF